MGHVFNPFDIQVMFNMNTAQWPAISDFNDNTVFTSGLR